MTESPLVKKLQIKPGYKLAIINPPEGYRKELSDLPKGAELTDDLDSEIDFVQLFVKNSEELDAFVSAAIQATKPGGLLWICYPKGTSGIITDLNRDVLRAAMARHGLAGVSLVAIDAVWSALRFRPSDEVKSKK